MTDDLGDMKDDAELYRAELVEKVCELDDDLTMMFLEGEEPSRGIPWTPESPDAARHRWYHLWW